MSYFKVVAIAAITVLLVIGIYDRYNIERIEKQIETVVATQIKAQVDAEIKAAQENAYLSEGFAFMSDIKSRVVQFYQQTGELPGSNRDVSLPIATELRGQSLKSAQVTEGGVITLRFNETTGIGNGTIQFIPSVNKSGTSMLWKCISTDYKKIKSLAATCDYKPKG